jgi:hypothetical protein
MADAKVIAVVGATADLPLGRSSDRSRSVRRPTVASALYPQCRPGRQGRNHVSGQESS